MTRASFTVAADIAAPLPLVWNVMVDVERWPEWTGSVSRVRAISSGALQVGSRVRIHQPKLPSTQWRVTELDPRADFTWVSGVPGVHVTARHAVAEIAIGTRVTLSIEYAGLPGGWLARWIGDLNGHYLTLEADGLRARCIAVAGIRDSKSYETH